MQDGSFSTRPRSTENFSHVILDNVKSVSDKGLEVSVQFTSIKTAESAVAGPVREQPTRVLGEKPRSRLSPPRPSGRPFAATRERRRRKVLDRPGHLRIRVVDNYQSDRHMSVYLPA